MSLFMKIEYVLDVLSRADHIILTYDFPVHKTYDEKLVFSISIFNTDILDNCGNPIYRIAMLGENFNYLGIYNAPFEICSNYSKNYAFRKVCDTFGDRFINFRAFDNSHEFREFVESKTKIHNMLTELSE